MNRRRSTLGSRSSRRSIISLPLAANLAGVDGADPGAENRELARSALDGSWASIGAFPTPRHWFDDHFGLRSTLVRWYGESRLFGLGVSPSAAVIVKGATAGSSTRDDRRSRTTRTRAADAGGDRELARGGGPRAGLAAARAASRYVFTIAPDKHVIYPEGCRRRIARIRATSRGPISCSPTLQDTGLAVDLRPALFEAKTARAHLSPDRHALERPRRAGRLSADHQRGARTVPATPAAWTRDDFEPVERDVEGMDLAAMMGLKRVLRETDLRAGAEAAAPGARRRAGRRRPDGRRRPARHRDRRPVAAARGDLPRLVRVAAGAVPVGTLQPRGRISGRTTSMPPKSIEGTPGRRDPGDRRRGTSTTSSRRRSSSRD